MADRELLVGDIGGTNARFAIAQPDGQIAAIKVLKVADFPNFADALDAYLGQLGDRPDAMCIASAGAKRGDEIHLTNAPWTLDESDLATRFGFPVVRIINDFAAQARFAGTMPAAAREELKSGTSLPGAPVLTIGPGTGFGQAIFLPGQPPRVVPTEGGHRLLPVRNARELRLRDRLEAELGHPPILEEALSGRGIVNLYRAVMVDRGEEPAALDPPAVTQAALAGPGAERDAILWFLDLLACAAADACLSTGARGGVAISGGIVPRITALLAETDFPVAFARPGILEDYLSLAPVYLVREPYAALYGTAAMMRDSLHG